MTDRVYPSTKPNGASAHPATAAVVAPPTVNPPPSKAHPYNPARHPYRPNPSTARRHKHERSFSCRRCFCLACFWSVLLLIAVLLLAAIAAAALYVLYRPQRPLFSVTSLKISALNLTTSPSDESTHLTARINVTLSARNPNKRITYSYAPMAIAVRSAAGSIGLSNGSFANFTSPPGNISIIHATTATDYQLLDADSANSLRSDLRRKRGLPMEIVMDTMVGVKMENVRMRKVGIRIRCDGIHGMIPRGKTVIPANTAGAKCKVDLRIKVLKWTF